MSRKILGLILSIVVVISTLPVGMVNAAATAISYVTIDRSNGLGVGSILEAAAVFTDEADNTEVVTYQWTSATIPDVAVNHGNNTANTTHYKNIAGATGNTYTIKASDKGKIIRVSATYNGATKYSADCVATDNILSMYSENPPILTVDRYANLSSKTVFEMGAGPNAGTADDLRKFWDSNNGDQNMYIANSVPTGMSANVATDSYAQSNANNLFVANYELESPVDLDNILVETGRGHGHSAIPVVYIKVAYEDDENTFKDWAHYKGSWRNEPSANYDRLYLLNVKGDSALISPVDDGKKITKIQVILYTFLNDKEGASSQTDSFAIRQISGFEKLSLDGPGITSISSSLGAELGVYEITNLLKGIKASQLISAISVNSVTASVKVVNTTKTAAIDNDTYVNGSMYVELTPKQGNEKVYYSLSMAADLFNSNFDGDIGKKSYRESNVVYGTNGIGGVGNASIPSGWGAIYSANPESSRGNTESNWDEAVMYFESYTDSVKGNGIGKLYSDGSQNANNFQLTQTNLNVASTAGKIFAFEANMRVGDKNSLKQVDLYLGTQSNNNFPKPIIFQNDGFIYVAGNKICEYDVNKWYNLVYVVDVQSRKVTGYLNGERVVNSKSYATSIALDAGVNRLSFFVDTAFPSGKTAGPEGAFYFDDAKIYLVKDASYTGSYSIPLTSSSNMVLAKEGKIKVPVNAGQTATIADVMSGLDIADGYTAKVYNYTIEINPANYAVTNLAAGMSITAGMADGSSFKMYSIETYEASAPMFYDKADTGFANPLSGIASGVGSIVITADRAQAENAVMAVALYDGDVLKNIVCDATPGTAKLSCEISLAGTTDPKVEVFVLEGFGGMKPILSKKYSIE